jgi:hypothetical protein
MLWEYFLKEYLSYICGALEEQVHTFYSSVEQQNRPFILLNLISWTQNLKIQNLANNCFIHTVSKISLYIVLLAIQHTVHIKIYTEVAPHRNVTVTLLGFIAFQFRNGKVAAECKYWQHNDNTSYVSNESVSVTEVSACFICTVFPVTVTDLVFVWLIKILKIILK